MHISINGVLMRAAERVEKTRDSKYLGWSLRQLLDHLRELRKDHSKVGEFFDLYTDSDPDGKALRELPSNNTRKRRLTRLTAA